MALGCSASWGFCVSRASLCSLGCVRKHGCESSGSRSVLLVLGQHVLQFDPAAAERGAPSHAKSPVRIYPIYYNMP